MHLRPFGAGARDVTSHNREQRDRQTLSTISPERDILAEFSNCQTLRPTQISKLVKNLGIPFSALVADEGYATFVVKADRICFLPDCKFEFERYSQGDTTAVSAATIVCRDELGDMADLCAWDVATNRAALWLGRVAMLGEQVPLEPRIGEPLMVFLRLLNGFVLNAAASLSWTRTARAHC
jgi:hypothetical protein